MLELEVESYRVFLVDSQVTILRSDGKEYAIGTWSELGGYVRYAGDGPKSGFDWRTFDLVDAALRQKLGWKTTARLIERPDYFLAGGGTSFPWEHDY